MAANLIVLGAAYQRGTQWFITAPEWYLLSTGVGVLFVLLVVPGVLARHDGRGLVVTEHHHDEVLVAHDGRQRTRPLTLSCVSSFVLSLPRRGSGQATRRFRRGSASSRTSPPSTPIGNSSGTADETTSRPE